MIYNLFYYVIKIKKQCFIIWIQIIKSILKSLKNNIITTLFYII